jgi:hypothetical protein
MKPVQRRILPYFLTQMGSKMATCPLINTKKRGQSWSNQVKIRQIDSAEMIWKNPGKP